MFRFLFKNPNLATTFGVRTSASCHRVGLLHVRFTTSTTTSGANEHSFTVSYLINECGLSPKPAISASRSFDFDTRDKPDKVLNFLKNYGFSQSQITNLVMKHPRVVLCNPETTILPKLEFLRSKGLLTSEITEIFSTTWLVHRSLKNHIIPTFALLRDFLKWDEKTAITKPRLRFLLQSDLQFLVTTKMKILRDNGVPDSSSVQLFRRWPRTLLMNLDRFQVIVNDVKEMGFDPSKSCFIQAILVLTNSKSMLKRKFDVFKGWGLSEEEIHEAFRIRPLTMMVSEDQIMAKMDLFVNKLGWKASAIAKRAELLTYSLEKRIVPRASILQYLVSKGLIGKEVRASFFQYPEPLFRKMLLKKTTSKQDWPDLLYILIYNQ